LLKGIPFPPIYHYGGQANQPNIKRIAVQAASWNRAIYFYFYGAIQVICPIGKYMLSSGSELAQSRTCHIIGAPEVTAILIIKYLSDSWRA